MSALLALLSSVVWGTSDFVAGLKARTLAPLAVVGYSQLVGFVTLSLVVLFGHPLAPGPWVGWALAAGVGGAIALAAFYSALATGTMSVVAPIASLGAAVPVLLGVVTGETPSAIAWVGMGVAVLGTVLASGPEIQAGLSVRPVALACVAAVGFGFVLFCMDRGSRVSLVSTLWGMRLTSLALYAGLAAVRRSTGGVGRRDWPVLLFVGVADLSANILFVSASTQGMVSIAAVLGSLYPVMTIMLARAFLGERLRWVQNVGVGLALLGVVAIATG
ncbi:DMT family transporter [Lapillicoccus sp.]|uniref:DMT family transporter n=1 Tax=Lapillicoccus sp. TaxID=1909287 RepID=UPI0027C69370|nr:DMT family transporter [Actinomycetota bacterium]